MKGEMLLQYRGFYFYLIYFLAASLAYRYHLIWNPQASERFRWNAELAGVVFGYGVLWEVFTHTIRPYVVLPLTAWIGFRACVALSIIGAMAIALAGADLWSLETSVKIETMFRSLQAIALMAMIVLVVYKRLPVGRKNERQGRSANIFFFHDGSLQGH